MILESILAESSTKLNYTKATCDKRVMPPNLVVQGAPGPAPVCVAVSNAEGNSFTAGVRNYLTALQEGQHFRSGVLLRDRRCRTITGKVALVHIADLDKHGVEYISVGKDEFALLNAIYDTLVAAEEHDLAIGTKGLTKSDFVRFLKDERVGRRSIVLSAVARLFPPLASQLGLDSQGGPSHGAAAASPPNP